MTAEAAPDSEHDAVASWRIDPEPPTVLGQMAAVWRYRRVYWMFTVRGLFHIYRNAILGILWMAIQPLAIAVPAIFIVGDVFKISVKPLPLPLFVLVGLASWILFRAGVQWMTRSLNANRGLLRVVYVPALLLMITMISPGVFQMLIVLALAGIAAIYYGPVMNMYHVPFGWHMFAVFPAMLILLALATAVACVTSILNTFARDTWLTLRYVLSGLMIATPIVYPVTVIPEPYRWIAYLNPLAAPVDLFRWALLGYGQIPWLFVGLSALQALVLLLCGIWFFATQHNRVFDHM
jgi:lipopolysaccharide transport system permease protein